MPYREFAASTQTISQRPGDPAESSLSTSATSASSTEAATSTAFTATSPAMSGTAPASFAAARPLKLLESLARLLPSFPVLRLLLQSLHLLTFSRMLGRRWPLLLSTLRSLLRRGPLACCRFLLSCTCCRFLLCCAFRCRGSWLLHAVPAAIVIFLPARARVFVNISVVTSVHIATRCLACSRGAGGSRHTSSLPARGGLNRSSGTLGGCIMLCVGALAPLCDHRAAPRAVSIGALFGSSRGARVRVVRPTDSSAPISRGSRSSPGVCPRVWIIRSCSRCRSIRAVSSL